MYKCSGRYGFGAVDLGNESNNISVPAECASKITKTSFVPGAVLYAKLQIAQYLQQDYTKIC